MPAPAIATASHPHRAGAPAAAGALPARAGVGLKASHFRDALESPGAPAFFEVHAENYLVAGGPLHHFLTRLRESRPLSLHGVSLSLGGADAPDETHLDALARLIDRYQPAVFSEHLAWSTHAGVYLNDLLPVRYDAPTLARVCRHVDRAQTRLKTRILLENPSTYVEFDGSTMTEAGFLAEVVRRTGCGLLLDLTNLHVSCVNHHRDVDACLRELPLAAVGEIHLAGFAVDRDGAGDPLLIDHHGCAVDPRVWSLFDAVTRRIGPRPTLIERDNDVPPLASLIAEAARADATLTAHAPRPS